MPRRCFPPLPDGAPGFSGRSGRGRGEREAALLDAAASCLETVERRAARWGVYGGLCGGGVAGLALAKLRAAQLLADKPEVFREARLARPGAPWAGWAPETFAREALESLAAAKEIMARDGEAGGCTFLCGLSGVLALQAQAWDVLGDAEGVQRALEALLKHSRLATQLPSEDCDLLYGRYGCLWGLLSVRNLWGSLRAGAERGRPGPAKGSIGELVAELTEQVLEEGRRNGAAGPGAAGAGEALPLLYRWRGKAYLGAAHGLVGILNTLLYLPQECLGGSDRFEDICRTVECLVALRLPGGNLPASLENRNDRLIQWCHGCPGLVHLLLHPGLGGSGGRSRVRGLLRGALEAGQVVWERGLLKKGLGLCHGVSGNAYSFLAQYRHTGDPKHLRRAEQFAAVVADSVASGLASPGAGSEGALEQLLDAPDRPASLMEGVGGAICLFLDLLDPANATFPGFDLPRPPKE